MSTHFYDTQVSTVYFQILFTKRNLEAILYKDTILVTSAMAGSGFASWQISLFVQRLREGLALISRSIGRTSKQPSWRRRLTLPIYSRAKIIGLKPENLKYLEFDYHVISTFDRKPPRYDAEQVDALLEIADAIRTKH